MQYMAKDKLYLQPSTKKRSVSQLTTTLYDLPKLPTSKSLFGELFNEHSIYVSLVSPTNSPFFVLYTLIAYHILHLESHIYPLQ